jgi:pimeloyl-ACP methyl ester carboxylesterase
MAKLGDGFVSLIGQVNGTSLHYVRGGAGPAVILLHGFPEDWYEYRKVMPRLAKKFTVVAIDLPGIGESAATPGEYDAAKMAEHIHGLLEQLELGRAYVVGHDIGGMVAFAYVRQFPEELRGAMILDVPVPGIGPQDEILHEAQVWHVYFHQVPGLAEKLVAGHQADYFRYFLHDRAFSEADIEHYARAYEEPSQLHAIFEMYRAFPADAELNVAERIRSDVPLLLAAGVRSPFLKYLPRIADDLRAHGFQRMSTESIAGSDHYIVEEASDRVIELIEQQASL